MSFVESDNSTYLKIKEMNVLSKGQLEFLSYLYRFGPCTTNELIDIIEKERPDLDRNSLDLFMFRPSFLPQWKNIVGIGSVIGLLNAG